MIGREDHWGGTESHRTWPPQSSFEALRKLSNKKRRTVDMVKSKDGHLKKKQRWTRMRAPDAEIAMMLQQKLKSTQRSRDENGRCGHLTV
ncbi:hypothetical protein OS493_022969 [Desmophyllum pertusum]|uniref:Uncharacterized protein n=1 Tax=Desmophyllum pertusum TaxID=174260 RepID=A0A9X0CWT0_9CNID|nr:hypothetical protein OS493_022969 [Desmophyllum pertusum]